MDQKNNSRKEGLQRKVVVNEAPVEESLLIRQRLRNLCELAVAIGQKKGLLGNHKEIDIIHSKQIQHVVAQEDVQDLSH